ncbi:MAG: bifunctional pyr operon transcriptional regulator/uracil phosphoribosyltransferase PyrR [Deltaproteobacteria bacterium]|nr:bifunctional pyr operon transcriptional regulator/uracil phosphoribosyltransferase PyrR [Deltaproteobacteria bacterium]
MSLAIKKTVLDAEGVKRSLVAMADEILAAEPDLDRLALVGIHTGGVFLARRLQTIIREKTGIQIPTGVVDINLYRDDWTRVAQKPRVGRTELRFNIDDRRMVLVDDVLFTGRTTRAAMDALMDFGRPGRIELAVLVDRGHRELPIYANYTALTLNTSREERVDVYFSELGQVDEVVIVSPNS